MPNSATKSFPEILNDRSCAFSGTRSGLQFWEAQESILPPFLGLLSAFSWLPHLRNRVYLDKVKRNCRKYKGHKNKRTKNIFRVLIVKYKTWNEVSLIPSLTPLHSSFWKYPTLLGVYFKFLCGDKWGNLNCVSMGSGGKAWVQRWWDKIVWPRSIAPKRVGEGQNGLTWVVHSGHIPLPFIVPSPHTKIKY